MPFRFFEIAILLLLVTFASRPCRAAEPPMSKLIPAEMNGWKADSSGGSYDRRNLYDYIDGGAEVYLAYDFRQAVGRRFVKANQPAITVDLFDMGTPVDAYGVFTFEQEGGSAGVGQDSEYAAGFLRFWKGRYFVSILADKETTTTKQAVMAFGKAIAQSIRTPGERPVIVSMLPSENLVASSVRYFHRKSQLDFQYFLADKNILNLDTDTEVALAQYKAGKSRLRLLVVGYPDAEKASTACRSFVSAFMPEARETGVLRLEDGKWVGVQHEGRLVTAVFEAPDREAVTRLLGAVKTKPEVSKHDK